MKWNDLANGELRVWGRKTGRVRYVPIREPLGAYLEAWKAEAPDDELVFEMGRDNGKPRDHRAWVRRRFRPAVTAAGLPENLRPYDLRHTCASLLNAEHRSTVEAAGWMGHSHELYLNTYTHVVSSMRGQGRVDVDAVIRAARVEAEANPVVELFADCSQTVKTVFDALGEETAVSPVVIGDW